ADNLPTCLRFRRRSLNFFPLCIPLGRIVTCRDRFLLRHLLALIVITDAIARPTGDLHAAVTIRPEAGVADQRTDAAGLALHRIQRISAGGLDLQLRPCVLVEEIERLLRYGVPVAVDGAGAAADAA